MSISGVTSVSTVGAKKVPASYFSPESRSPPSTRLAPLPTASETCRSIFSIAPSSISGPVVEHAEEGFGQGTVHEDPVGADAGLAGVEELDQRGAPGGVRRVGVGKHDERRVPAELERHSLD